MCRSKAAFGWLVVVGLATAARAQLPLGDGRSGPLTVSTPDVQVNRYARVLVDAPSGATELTVVGDLIREGELLLVVQLQDDSVVATKGATSVDLRGTDVGRYAWAHVVAVAGNVLTLDTALPHAFRAGQTQVVVTPEYTEVTILDGGSITAPSWDGATGGVLAFLSTGPVTNDGLVSASGRGFRGGAGMPYQMLGPPDGGVACTEEVDAFPYGSMVGEGVGGSWGTQFGRGPNVLGGGGGGCLQAGGAGGAFIGLGGRGGDNVPGGGNGGLGPPAVLVSAPSQFLLGGGGGAGWSSASYSTRSVTGGNGGGAVLVHAAEFLGSGTWSADGSSPSDFGGGDWGYGGGGAGGAVLLRARQRLSCGLVSVAGAHGGRYPNGQGPGGGGGGGLVALEGADIHCPAVIFAGTAGVAVQGATPVSATDTLFIGAVTVTQPARGPVDAGGPWGPSDAGAPVLSLPDGGSLAFTSSPNSSGYCGAPYKYSAAGRPQLSENVPALYSLQVEPARDGVTIDERSGEVTWRPTKADVGTYAFTVRAKTFEGEITQQFEVVVECDAPSHSAVGCTCGSPGGSGLSFVAYWALGAMALAYRNRWSRRAAALCASHGEGREESR